MNNNSLTIAAISVLAALLATGAAISSETAFAGGHHYSKSVRQTAALDNNCGNGTMPLDINCQNLASQVKGNHNAANVLSFQPSSSSRADQGNDHRYDGGSHDDQGNNQSGGQGDDQANGGQGGNHASGGQGGNQASGGQGGNQASGGQGVNHASGGQGVNHASGGQGVNHASGGQANGGQSRSQGGSHTSGSLAVGNPVGNPGIGAGA
jgi:hypothetical protein